MDVKQPTAGNIKPFPQCWFETTRATFGGYLAEALASRAYKVAPAPLVVNTKGLDGVQEAVDLMRVVGQKGWEGIRDFLDRAGKEGVQGEKMGPVKLVVERP